MATADALRSALNVVVDDDLIDALEAAIEDEMDAPSDWDSGVVTFDPYL